MVCALEHPGDNWRDKRLLGTDSYWYVRPRQLTEALDALLASDPLGARIDRARIGALGFSSGGYTVLAAAGGRPDLKRLHRHCADPSRDPRFCAYRKPDEADLDPTARQGTRTPDRRLKALVLIAPVGAPFGDGGLADVDAQIRLYRAGADQILAHPFHAEHIHTELMRDHDYRIIDDLHHFGFIEPLPWIAKVVGIEVARDPHGFKRAAFLERVNVEIVAFFQSAL
jgi:predicted dienelactone hydrolase